MDVDYKCSCQPSHQKTTNVRCPCVSTRYKDEQGSDGTHSCTADVCITSKWSASRLGRFTPEVKDGDAHRTGGCAKSSDNLDNGKQQRNCTPADNRIALVQPVVSSL